MPIALLRRYGQLCQDESTLPDRIELLEEHAQIVTSQLAALNAQQAKFKNYASGCPDATTTVTTA